MREFVNSETNHLGVPLPKGRMRFYRRDDDGQLEFIGENELTTRRADETIRVYTGNAFDLVGERKQTNFQLDSGGSGSTNPSRSSCATTRRSRWKSASSSTSTAGQLGHHRKVRRLPKNDAQTIEFRVQVKPDEEKTSPTPSITRGKQGKE